MRSPFKFLDPFTLADKNVFFGRKKETLQLYRQVLRTRLLLLYGLSGTGKSSLIQCGLAGEFNGPEWLPLWIRKESDINDSLQSAIRRLLPVAKDSIPEQVRQLYQKYLRPIYLIFDQFEEIFILGTPSERTQFISTLKNLLADDSPCTIILVIREEYLGRLYQFEKAIPGLFDFRMRVERMDTANVKSVLRDSFREFNIAMEQPEEILLDEIINNISLERSGIELPYLQVYLDQLYRQDLGRTYPNDSSQKGNPWPTLEFTRQEIQDFGTIDKVLFRFLNQQKQRIQHVLVESDFAIAPETVKLVLDGFVTDEGTKRPIRYARHEGTIKIDPAQQVLFPALPELTLTLCLDELERAKILRVGDDFIEIAHDTLAQIIDNERSDEQRERNNMRSQIRLALAMFSKTGDYLTPKQLVRFEDIVPQLDEKERKFFQDSKKVRDNEANENLKKEKEQASRIRNWLIVAVVGFIVAAIGGVYAYWQQQNAEKEKNTKQAIIDALYFYKGRFAIAQKEINGSTKFGFINKNGLPEIDYIYDEVTQFSETDGFARVKREKKNYLLDTLKNEYLLATTLNEITDQTTALDLSSQQLDSIPETIFRYPKIKVLLLYNNSIKHISERIAELTSLTTLNLYINKLTSLPPQIEKLTALREVVLSFNEFDSLGPQIGELNSLITLNLSHNRLTSLPPQIGKLSSLETLYLESNELVSLSSKIGELNSLITLNLSSNKLTKLPSEIGKLNSLKTLVLGYNKLTKLPFQIGKLISLISLDLSGNQLISLPTQIWNLTSLTDLNLANSQLAGLPAQIRELTNLTRLNLGDNQLTNLPNQIGSLTNLSMLNLDQNKFKIFPPIIENLTHLTYLSFNGNKLTKCPPQIEKLTNLTKLILTENKLKTLPPEIGNLTHLTHLSLTGNELTNIPREIGNLTHLAHLSLSVNKLTNLPPEIGNLTGLTYLSLSGNELKILPSQFEKLTSLTKLNLAGNKLKILPPQIKELASLSTLNLSMNQLTRVPPQIGELTSLTKLNLSFNKLKVLPPQIEKLTTLNTLDLGDNLIPEATQSEIKKLLPWVEIQF
ncbi:leucine-rich repeat domain-containing protein [Dyadobacter sp. 32]|uniref:leucine-rich repeat domain-containing protein n=1 Tax=Dyadobacter sp. 32 TaxID=538966 RepID=UPI0011ED86D5